MSLPIAPAPPVRVVTKPIFTVSANAVEVASKAKLARIAAIFFIVIFLREVKKMRT
jgi:hypothetical protein